MKTSWNPWPKRVWIWFLIFLTISLVIFPPHLSLARYIPHTSLVLFFSLFLALSLSLSLPQSSPLFLSVCFPLIPHDYNEEVGMNVQVQRSDGNTQQCLSCRTTEGPRFQPSEAMWPWRSEWSGPCCLLCLNRHFCGLKVVEMVVPGEMLMYHSYNTLLRLVLLRRCFDVWNLSVVLLFVNRRIHTHSIHSVLTLVLLDWKKWLILVLLAFLNETKGVIC